MKTFLNFIERAGNKLPHPFILFWILALITILVSWGMSHLNLGLSNPKTGAAVVVRSLVSEDGLRFMLDGVVKNFIAFPPLGVIIVVMFGIGVADRVGLIGTLMQLTVVKAPPKLVTTAIVVSA
ncbi:MAG: AbgT family transporter, partial [Burkholderiaceae bacterium]|nr:AbgT family transporter [Burkholderiaceae bacterium]